MTYEQESTLKVVYLNCLIRNLKNILKIQSVQYTIITNNNVI